MVQNKDAAKKSNDDLIHSSNQHGDLEKVLSLSKIAICWDIFSCPNFMYVGLFALQDQEKHGEMAGKSPFL